ncbi:MAG: MFS transporter [Gemmatimonadetes bacterium]|nr:MFS transporter [Gemmatimonadota bacterium]
MHRLRPRSLLAAGALALSGLAGCYAPLKLTPSDAATVLSRQLLDAPDPSLPGPFAVKHLYYGSGTDRRRPEYRDSVSIRTDPVDASKLVDLRDAAKARNRYWGFSPKNFPRNGRVWYPDGPGPFPLVLVVHGNHDPEKFSDPGYEYLGTLLASRGYIVASVDENFLNGSIRQENDARAWLLLKHLEAWRRFNTTQGGPLFGRVDMDHVALMGHSRGGEAVAEAAAFNRLSHYPDDANVRFDFHFPIRAVIAIAPVDAQYTPADQQNPVENVNYMVFHGSHDGDVSSFTGLRQYQRVRFTDGAEHFKTAIYVYRANHGQWNTVWGPRDNGPRSNRMLDLRGLLPPEEQRQFARVYVSAFLDASLKGERRYLPLFRDHRVAGGWLPKTMYVTRFQESSFHPLATFQEDIDVTTGTARGVAMQGDSLATWREGGLKLRSRNGSQDNNAVWLGWNNRLAGADTTRRGPAAAYALTLPDSLLRSWEVDGRSSIDLSLAPTPDAPGPRRDPAAKPDSSRSGKGGGGARTRRPPAPKGEPKKEPMDLTVEVADAAGHVARLPLSRFGPVRRPLEAYVLRRRDREKTVFPTQYELVMQSYSIPLADFQAAAPDFDPRTLRRVRLVFDRTTAGTVVLDDVGIARMDPAFTRVEVPAE